MSEIIRDFKVDYESVRREKGFTHKKMAEEMNISDRYLRYLRKGGTAKKGGRQGLRGKGAKIKKRIYKEYEEKFKLFHFLIMVYYISQEKYLFFHKQRRCNINKVTDEVFSFKVGEIVSVAYTSKKSEIPDLIAEILADYNKKDITNYKDMIITGLKIREDDRLIDLL